MLSRVARLTSRCVGRIECSSSLTAPRHADIVLLGKKSGSEIPIHLFHVIHLIHRLIQPPSADSLGIDCSWYQKLCHLLELAEHMSPNKKRSSSNGAISGTAASLPIGVYWAALPFYCRAAEAGW